MIFENAEQEQKKFEKNLPILVKSHDQAKNNEESLVDSNKDEPDDK